MVTSVSASPLLSTAAHTNMCGLNSLRATYESVLRASVWLSSLVPLHHHVLQFKSRAPTGGCTAGGPVPRLDAATTARPTATSPAPAGATPSTPTPNNAPAPTPAPRPAAGPAPLAARAAPLDRRGAGYLDRQLLFSKHSLLQLYATATAERNPLDYCPLSSPAEKKPRSRKMRATRLAGTKSYPGAQVGLAVGELSCRCRRCREGGYDKNYYSNYEPASRSRRPRR